MIAVIAFGAAAFVLAAVLAQASQPIPLHDAPMQPATSAACTPGMQPHRPCALPRCTAGEVAGPLSRPGDPGRGSRAPGRGAP